MNRSKLLVGLFTILMFDASANAQISGRYIPELSWADITMLNFMTEHGISGGLLGIMKDGCVVYQRGFGWMDNDQNITMPENALVRIASCTKPITAAAIQKLAAEGAFGPDGIDRLAFNLGQSNPGVLNINPWPSLGDSRMRNITIRHLLLHQGGWDRDPDVGPGDVTYMECTIASDMGINSP
ncbi:MAG: beta-lactamase family protein, partial [Phycisphaerales bacterium]|nr:beta-lactamase family protein [Phycisphaerales bacterium]